MSKRIFDKQEIEKKVNEILVDKLGVDHTEIKPDATLRDDLGADSLDIVELIMEFEKDFNISIPDDKVESMTECTVGAVYKLIEEMV
ncbi:MAG: acyl carrier protein [Prevotella sp.]|nr:acyl carrier protein [Prevotella sp.]